jgi:hypothetical protein
MAAERLAHALVCRDGMSPEDAAGVMAGSYGLHVSPSGLRELLEASACPDCASELQLPAGGAEPVRATVHQATASGWLTGQLGDGS